MKKLIGIMCLFPFLFSPAAIAGVCEEADITRHLKLPPGVTLDVVSKREVNGMCEMIVRPSNYTRLLSLYATKDFVILGSMFEDKRELDKESIRKAEKQEFLSVKPELDQLAAFSYKPEEVKRTAYLFTDPDCPYCNRAKKRIREFADQHNLEVKVIFFPVHKTAEEKIISGICEKMTFEDYLAGRYGEKACPEGKETLKKSREIARRIGVSGTPTLIFDNGKRAVGFSPARMARVLEEGN